MGLHIGGSNVAGLRFGGRAAAEARLNGSVVWPDTPPVPVDPWPTRPYLLLRSGERIQVMEGTYTPVPQYEPGGRVLISSGATCSLLYPDTRSAGADLLYELESGAKIVYTHSDGYFRAYDRNGTLQVLDQSLPDYPGAYNLSLFYAYAGETLLMGFWYSTPTYMRVDRKAASGVPGHGTAIRNDTYYGLTDENLAMLHDFAMALTGGSQ